jgi:hypothetical protein
MLLQILSHPPPKLLVSERLGSNETTKCSPMSERDGRTPNLLESRVIWQGLLDKWETGVSKDCQEAA